MFRNIYGHSVVVAHRHSAPARGLQPLWVGSIPAARAIFSGSSVKVAHKISDLAGEFQSPGAGSIPVCRSFFYKEDENLTIVLKSRTYLASSTFF
jgi:hypothetical protein